MKTMTNVTTTSPVETSRRATKAASAALAGAGLLLASILVGPLPARAAAPVPGVGAEASQPDSLYRAGRDALNRGQHARAARLFERLRERYPDSDYVGDALYFEAFALYRTGSEDNLERARELLEIQAEEHREAATREDARTLGVRIRGALARRGDTEAWSQVESEATSADGCEQEDQETRLMALSALHGMNPDRAVPILEEILRSRDECSAEIRARGVFILSQKMTDGTVDLLLELAHENPDPDPEVRQAAVFWLSQVKSPEAVDALTEILRGSDDTELQGQALFALSQHDTERAGAALVEYARRNDGSAELRARAIFWLGQRGDEVSIEVLRSLYADLESDELREKILFSVAQSGSEEAADWLLDRALDSSESTELRKNAVFWLGQAGAPAGRLLEIYEELDDLEVREHVIFALSQSDSEAALDALLRIARTEENTELRQRAVFWLGQKDDPRVQELLLEIIRGS